jgi:hypothetical protein
MYPAQELVEIGRHNSERRKIGWGQKRSAGIKNKGAQDKPDSGDNDESIVVIS